MDYIKVHEEIKNTYIAKNADYGNSFEKSLDTFGLIAGLVRISDKFERLINLGNPKNAHTAQVNESIQDTLKDAANYCIMTAAWLEKTKNPYEN